MPLQPPLPVRSAIAVIGGGPAGYFGAITAARHLRAPSSVVLLESTNRPLRKVLASGGGRCNVMHAPVFTPRDLARGHYPRGRRAMVGPFTAFNQEMTRDWFVNEGVDLKTESDGRVFPRTDDSRTVASALEDAAVREGVQLLTGATVRDVSMMEGGDDYSSDYRFQISFTTKQQSKPSSAFSLRCGAVLLATGSAPVGFNIAKKLGVKCTAPYPSLFSFRLCDGHPVENLQGVSIPDAELTLIPDETEGRRNGEDDSNETGEKLKRDRDRNVKDLTQRGPLLITHRGVSGPAALRLSAFAARELKLQKYSGTLALNLIPDSSGPDEVSSALRQYSMTNGRKSLSTPLGTEAGTDMLIPRLPRRLWRSLLTHCDLDPATKWAYINKRQVALLSKSLTSLPLRFAGKDTNKEEFVTAGGVNLDGVNLKRMESKLLKGLFFAGEVLDVDGVTGGFNFQNCWSTGHIAGLAMAESVAESRW